MTDDLDDPFERAVAREEEERRRSELHARHLRLRPWRNLQSSCEGLAFFTLTFLVHLWLAEGWNGWLTAHVVTLAATFLGSIAAYFDYRAQRIAGDLEI